MDSEITTSHLAASAHLVIRGHKLLTVRSSRGSSKWFVFPSSAQADLLQFFEVLESLQSKTHDTHLAAPALQNAPRVVRRAQ